LGHLAPDFRIVKSNDGSRVYEQCNPVDYTNRAADKVMDVVAATRTSLWRTVTSAPPYRRYYLYLSNPGESRLPQIVSAYMLLFWLGSLTRYRPVELLAELNGTLGGYLREFLATQPQQLPYSLASEFRQQEVSKAAVV
jgi:YaaC-like Protein